MKPCQQWWGFVVLDANFLAHVILLDGMSAIEYNLMRFFKGTSIMKGSTAIAVYICLLMLSGCHAKQVNDPVDDLFGGVTKSGGYKNNSSSKVGNYLAAIMGAVQSHMFELERFSGKVCDIKVSLNRSGKVTHITAVGGYPPLCEAGIKAIKSADIPAPPDEETYLVFKESILEIKPL